MLISGKKRKRSTANSESGSESPSVEAPNSPDGKGLTNPSSPLNPEDGTDEAVFNKEEGEHVKPDEDDGDISKENKENGASTQPRELHRTASIFLRNLAPTITKLEVEAVSLNLTNRFW